MFVADCLKATTAFLCLSSVLAFTSILPKTLVTPFKIVGSSPSKAVPELLCSSKRHSETQSDEYKLSTSFQERKNEYNSIPFALTPAALALFTALPADAAGTVPAAFVAYSHYVTLLIATIALTVERVLVKPGMPAEDEKTLNIANLVIGISTLGIFASGGARAALDYDKGWAFYSHEPIFWLKLSLAGIFVGLYLFPTIINIKRGGKRSQNGSIPPMSQELGKRMQTVLNAEISALLSIPLTATLMARGVSYWESFPWPVGAALVVLAFGGSGYKYGKEALTWNEEEYIKKKD